MLSAHPDRGGGGGGGGLYQYSYIMYIRHGDMSKWLVSSQFHGMAYPSLPIRLASGTVILCILGMVTCPSG